MRRRIRVRTCGGPVRPISPRLTRLGLVALAILFVSTPSLAQTPGPCDFPNTCTIWAPSQAPVKPAASDPNPVEVGVRFRTTVNGFITAIRFYKGAANNGTHIASLWTSDGTLLMRATFVGETASGWQQVAFPSPIPVIANTSYIASYHTTTGYAADQGYFSTSGVIGGTVEAPQDGVDGGNGVYVYGNPGFPANPFKGTNYWVDVVFATWLPPDTTAPIIKTTSPRSNASDVTTGTAVSATFSELIDPATISSATFQLFDNNNVQVPGPLTYAAAALTATFQPTTPLRTTTTYTAVVRGGSGGIKDMAGNPLAADVQWTFTTASAPPPPPNTGPGGPLLIVTSTANPFTTYYAEILRGEGLNAFALADIGAVTAATLQAYDVVILGEQPLTAAQVTMFSNWVTAGGNLIAMRPDKGLAPLLGLLDAAGTLADAYLQIDTSAAPGAGIVGATMQFHGTADRYTLNGATSVATLFSSAIASTTNPGVTVRSVGSAGGQAAAFTYDLARSVVYTRQGNPAWSGQERDGSTPIRSDDLFFGGAQPNYVDLSKVAIPQADEQQRLLANLIGFLDADRKPLPKFWYFPRGLKAVVVMTGDDHATNGTAGRFDIYKANSAPGCVVGDWQCVRATSYIYPTTPISNAAAAAYVSQGFEIAAHLSSFCNDFTASSLDSFFADDLQTFADVLPDVPKPRTNRTHCVPWSDYDTQPQVEAAHGIRLDTNYYYWPASWAQNVPGLFTGSGMPERFARADGTILDIYQATTQLTDESAQSYPLHIDTLLDRALGPEGYFGSFVTNMHTDLAVHAGSAAIVTSAQQRGVPIISAQQLLEWIDGRNASSFANITWNGRILSFTVSLWSGTNGIQVMVPATSTGGNLVGILNDSVPIDYTTETVKGVSYGRFSVSPGRYDVYYGADTIPPVISAISVTPLTNSATITWHTNEPGTSRVDYGLSPSALSFSTTAPGLGTSHGITLTGLAGGTQYYFRVTSADALSNVASAPASPATFTTSPVAPLSLVDTTVADFTAGSGDSGTYVTEMTDGEVVLTPSVIAEFSGASLPAGWSATQWSPGGTSTVGNGRLVVDAARVGTDVLFAPGRSLEFEATFSGQQFQHAGFAVTFAGAPWAAFSTGAGGGLYARTNNGTSSLDTPLPVTLLGTPHRFRIDWTAAGVDYWIDDAQVASHPITITENMRPLVSDLTPSGGTVTVNWMRLSPYATSGTFISRVMDSSAVTEWANIAWNASVPAGTSLSMSARFGNTAVPDGTWTPFIALSQSGVAIAQTSRFVQYQAVLTGSGSATPILQSVAVNAVSPAPSVSVNNVTVTEGDTGTTVAMFTLTLSAPMAIPVSVAFATANDSATAGSDYVASSGTAVFDPGVTSINVPVLVNGDAVMENTETFFLNLTAPVNVLIADPQGIGTIIDNDLTLISIAGATVTEGNAGVTNATFVVSLARGISQPVTVDYTTSDVTTTAGVDYATTSGTLTFPPGNVQQSIVVPVIGDTLNEANETFRVTLSNATNGTITTGQATGTITNDDPVVSVTIGDVTITEGSGGTVSAQVPVTLSTAAGQTVSVGFTTAAGTAAATTDYTTTTGTVTFPAGSTSQTIVVPIVTDLTYESDETFAVNLRTPVNVTIARTQAIVTIVNDDPVPQISISNPSVTEGNTGTVNGNFSVTLSNPSSSVITVNYATADGTAVAGLDYTAVSGVVSFSAGATSRTITVPIIGDTLAEPNETFTVNLSAPVNATLATTQATGTILDNDPQPSIRITDLTLTEGDTGTIDAVLTVTLSAASSFPISVNYATGTTGTATPGVDFTPVSGTLSFAPGVTSLPVTVAVIGDTINEANETIHVDLTTPVNATIADSRGIITIVENDPVPSITVNDISVTEGNSGTKTATFTFTLSAASAQTVRVTYATADGTAFAGIDYTARSGTLTFNPGVTTLTLAITVRGDTVPELDETVLLNLSAPANATLTRTSATLTILNDD